MKLPTWLGIAQPEPNISTPTEPRTSATVGLELQLTDEADKSIAAKISGKQADLAEARARFDRALEAHVLTGVGEEPSRGEVEGLTMQLDALSRIAREKRQAVKALRSELAALELAEAVAAGQEAIPALTRRAEALLSQFEVAVQEARELESDLMRVLFSESEGLKQNFPAELRADANRARWNVRQQLEAIGRKSRFSLHPEFETDGNPNLGSTEAWYLALVTLPPKVHEVRHDPREVGAIVPEQNDHEPITRLPGAIFDEFAVTYDRSAA